jgi:hypothetical protein
MYQELISYSFDAEEWTADGNLVDFTQIVYPDILEELIYGDLALTDEKDHVKCLHLSEVELGYLAINLAYHAQQLQAGKATKAIIASPYQHFELSLQLDAEKICTISFVEEPEKQIGIHLDTLLAQTRDFRKNLWVDMVNHYPSLATIEGYEAMETAFNA